MQSQGTEVEGSLWNRECAAEAERPLAETDPEVAEVIALESRRQMDKLTLIASENLVPRAVREAETSMLMNKYAEGFPGARYYGGCQYADVIEELARRRLAALFGAEHANVQPHSGAQANMAAYLALCRPGDRILAMDLAHGGHLSHGSPVNYSGRLFRFAHYTVDRETETIDMDEVEALARRIRPALIVAGAAAYPRTIDYAAFALVAEAVGARLMVDMAHVAGLVAAGLHPNPVPYADVVTTTTHKTLRGPRGGAILCRAAHAQAVDRAVFPGLQGGPLLHVIAAKAVCFREAGTARFAAYQAQVLRNAQALAEGLQRRGFRLVAGGTDTHLLLVDLRAHGLTGRQAERALDLVGIVVNKNLIPFDPQPPMRTSGIRLGTPAVTARGMGDAEMAEVAAVIADVLSTIAADPTGIYPSQADWSERVRTLTTRFPLPEWGGA